MEAPIENTVSAPEAAPENPSVEPQISTAPAVVDEPIPADTPQVTDTPNTVETPKGEETAEVPLFDEAALEETLDEIASKFKFTFKEDVKVEPSETPQGEETKELPIDPADKVIIDELTEVAQIYSEENKKFQEDIQSLTTDLEKERTEKQEAVELAKTVDGIFNEMVKDLPILEQYAEARAKGEPFELPPIYREEVQKALQEHPIIGPLNRALINGEKLPIAEFVKSLAEYRRSTAPRITDAKNSVPTIDTKGTEPSRLGNFGGVKFVKVK